MNRDKRKSPIFACSTPSLQKYTMDKHERKLFYKANETQQISALLSRINEDDACQKQQSATSETTWSYIQFVGKGIWGGKWRSLKLKGSGLPISPWSYLTSHAYLEVFRVR